MKPPGREYEKITSDVRKFFARTAEFDLYRFQRLPTKIILQNRSLTIISNMFIMCKMSSCLFIPLIYEKYGRFLKIRAELYQVRKICVW
ncbi:hypothetical protein C4J81_12345 [Deltaproteobacteria bacterium Smac51]|nr:hypothetical protein C4J81_12345 [Deltaproteobacteria bacterium Smac51]